VGYGSRWDRQETTARSVAHGSPAGARRPAARGSSTASSLTSGGSVRPAHACAYTTSTTAHGCVKKGMHAGSTRHRARNASCTSTSTAPCSEPPTRTGRELVHPRSQLSNMVAIRMAFAEHEPGRDARREALAELEDYWVDVALARVREQDDEDAALRRVCVGHGPRPLAHFSCVRERVSLRCELRLREWCGIAQPLIPGSCVQNRS
jgi:hypothetical protein